MAKWDHILNVKCFYHDDSISIEEKGKLMAAAIKRLPLHKIELYSGDDFEDVMYQFEDITGDEDTTPIEEFDEIMNTLYDMADRYNIWIDTI